MSKYDDLDSAIVAYLKTGREAHPIYSMHLTDKSMRLIGNDVTESDNRVWRLIDSRLQALKKAGKIRFERPLGRWVAI